MASPLFYSWNTATCCIKLLISKYFVNGSINGIMYATFTNNDYIYLSFSAQTLGESNSFSVFIFIPVSVLQTQTNKSLG